MGELNQKNILDESSNQALKVSNTSDFFQDFTWENA